MSVRTMSAVFLIAGLVIGATIGYMITPKGVSEQDYATLQSQNTALQAEVNQLQIEVTNLGGRLNYTETINIAHSTTLGEYFTDINGHAIYYFAKDVPGKGVSAATNATIAANWPPFYAQTLVVPPGINIADFSSFQRSDGKLQSSYKGWPLYLYIQDTAIGDVKGDGVNHLWYVMEPNYSVMLAYVSDAGLYMVTVDGKAIYYFASDIGHDFTNQTLTHPPNLVALQAGESVDAPSYALGAYFGTMRNNAGQLQLTYRGWPLYTYTADLGPGDHNGDGYAYNLPDLSNLNISLVPAGPPVALQYVMKPDYTLMTAWNLANGTYLTDGAGMTLYYYTGDSPDVSRTTPAQLTHWLPYSTTLVVTPNVGAFSLTKVFNRVDSTPQMEFFGHPLYYYDKDLLPGDAKGENVIEQWYYLDPYNPPPTTP